MLTQENLNNIAAWQEALLSGRYEQAKGCLYNITQGGMCCLGVGANVWMQPNWQVNLAKDVGVGGLTNHKDDEIGGIKTDETNFGYDDAVYGILPNNIFEEKTGLNKYIQDNLAHENDSGKTFAEISTIIQKIIANPLNHVNTTAEELEAINRGEYDDLEY